MGLVSNHSSMRLIQKFIVMIHIVVAIGPVIQWSSICFVVYKSRIQMATSLSSPPPQKKVVLAFLEPLINSQYIIYVVLWYLDLLSSAKAKQRLCLKKEKKWLMYLSIVFLFLIIRVWHLIIYTYSNWLFEKVDIYDFF